MTVWYGVYNLPFLQLFPWSKKAIYFLLDWCFFSLVIRNHNIFIYAGYIINNNCYAAITRSNISIINTTLQQAFYISRFRGVKENGLFFFSQKLIIIKPMVWNFFFKKKRPFRFVCNVYSEWWLFAKCYVFSCIYFYLYYKQCCAVKNKYKQYAHMYSRGTNKPTLKFIYFWAPSFFFMNLALLYHKRIVMTRQSVFALDFKAAPKKITYTHLNGSFLFLNLFNII